MRENALAGRSISQSLIFRGDAEDPSPLLQDGTTAERDSEPCASAQLARFIVYPPRECGLPLALWALGWLLLVAWAAESAEALGMLDSALELGSER